MGRRASERPRKVRRRLSYSAAPSPPSSSVSCYPAPHHPSALKLAFGRGNRSSDELIDAIVDMSVTARRDGCWRSSASRPITRTRSYGKACRWSWTATIRKWCAKSWSLISMPPSRSTKDMPKFSSPPGICSYHGDHRYRHGIDPRAGQSARPNRSRTFDRGRVYRHFIRRRKCQYYLLPIASKIKARSEEEIANMERARRNYGCSERRAPAVGS